MALPGLFRVATEFRFEIGSAVLNTQALTSNVEKLSNAADGALAAFKRLSIGVITQFGLGGTSILGVFSQAIKSSENFRKSQLDFVNIISANRDKLVGPIEDFNKQMIFSGKILEQISKQAREFGLPEQEFVGMAKLLTAQLAGKGLAGTNFQVAIDMARNFLKSAPTLGIDPQMAMGQLLRATEGGATMGDTLFRRLVGETQPMKEFANATKKFNQLDPAKRVDLLSKSLSIFASNMDVLQGRADTVTAQLGRLRNVFVGLRGILKPIGDVLVPMIVDILKQLEEMINKHGRVIAENLAKFIKPFARDLEGTIATFIQIRRLSKDIAIAGTLLAGIAIGKFLLGITVFRTVLFGLGKMLFGILGLGAVKGMSIAVRLLPLLAKGLLFLATKVFIPLLLIITAFQAISRAIAVAKVRDMKAMPEFVARLSPTILKLKNALMKLASPFIWFIESFGEAFAVLFQRTTLLEIILPMFEWFVDLLDQIGDSVVTLTAALWGLNLMIVETVKAIVDLDFANVWKRSMQAGERGFQDVLQRFSGDLTDDTKKKDSVSQRTTNIYGGIKIQNEFRENLEPDRIAFTLKEQLLKAARTPTQARGHTFTRATAPFRGA